MSTEPHNRVLDDIPGFHSLIIHCREKSHVPCTWHRLSLQNYKEKHRKYTYKLNIEARSRYHFCRGKAICITHAERGSVASVFQHAMRMRCIILSSVACLALPCFSTLSHQQLAHVTMTVTTVHTNVPFSSCFQDTE